jgi:hypothetical protein
MVTNTCSPRDIAPNRRLDREAVKDVRLEVRTNNWVKVPIGQKHWSVRS